MKKFITIISALVLGMGAANAQTLWVNGGYQLDNFKSKILGFNASDASNGLFVGAEYEYGFGNFFSVAPGANLGFTFAEKTFVCDMSIPVLARAAYSINNQVKPFVNLGPEFNIGLAHNESGESWYGGYGLSRFGFNLALGGGVVVNEKVRLMINYSFGLSNIYKDSEASIKKDYLRVGIGYSF